MELKNAFPVFLLVAMTTFASARVKHPSIGKAPASTKPEGLEFIENKGQWVPEAKYMAGVPGGVMFITNNGFVYNYASQEDLETVHELIENDKDVQDAAIRHHAYKHSGTTISIAGHRLHQILQLLTGRIHISLLIRISLTS